MSLYNQISYRSPYPYIVNNFIREYDLSAANINALLSEGIISEKQYGTFLSMPKKQREIAIGNMSRDKTVMEAIQRGIKKAKKELFLSNRLLDEEIVSIKNDAVFVLGRELQYTVFGNYHFKMKNEYTIYMRLCDLEIYYGDMVRDGEIDINIDVKGISDEVLYLHEHGMLGFICDTCNMIQRYSPDEVLSYVIGMYNKFITRQLPIEFYREFNSNSRYPIIAPVSAYYLDYIDHADLNKIDINRNTLIMRELIYIVSSIRSARTNKKGIV